MCKTCWQLDRAYAFAIIAAEEGTVDRKYVLWLSRDRWAHRVECHGYPPPAAEVDSYANSRNQICRECGTAFAGSVNALYCHDCKSAHIKTRMKRCYQTRKQRGTAVYQEASYVHGD